MIEKRKPLLEGALAGESNKGSSISGEHSNECQQLQILNHLDGFRHQKDAQQGDSVGSGSAPLGMLPKHLPPVDLKEVFCKETGEIKVEFNDFEKSQNSRQNRWALKSVVNKILPTERVSKCMIFRRPVPGGLQDITLSKNPKLNKAFYQGLFACGKVWLCPICSAKISEKRKLELKDALTAAKNKNLGIHFVTLTFPHGAGDDLSVITNKLTKSYSKLSNGKYSVKNQLKKLVPDASIYGFIRALEVTHGKNGFHPHVHMLVFTDIETGSSLLEKVYSDAWKRACRLSGLPIPSDEHGCTVQDGSYASDYVGKFGSDKTDSKQNWGLEDEMTKANTKQNKQKGLTPWGLLRCALDGDDQDYPPKRSISLFAIYAKAFKNKRQLYWSNGLRRLLVLDDSLSDEDLVDKPDEVEAVKLADITPEQWKLIRKKKLESYLLDLAENSPNKVKNSIEAFTFKPTLKEIPREPDRPIVTKNVNKLKPTNLDELKSSIKFLEKTLLRYSPSDNAFYDVRFSLKKKKALLAKQLDLEDSPL